MTGTIQFTNSKGDGTEHTYKYVKADLNISDKNGQLYYYDLEREDFITLKFNITHLSMDCNFLSIRGNSESYHDVRFLMNTGNFWEAELEAERLKSQYENARGYFVKSNNITEEEEDAGIDFVRIARDQIEEKKKDK